MAMDQINLQELARLLTAMGCPQERADLMAAQLDKRATQLALLRGRPYEDALAHLIGLMRQGINGTSPQAGGSPSVKPPA